jgi:hypothetical protein
MDPIPIHIHVIIDDIGSGRGKTETHEHPKGLNRVIGTEQPTAKNEGH